MAIFAWQDLHIFDLLAGPNPPPASVEVASPWIMAVEMLEDATHLRIVAEDAEWVAMPGLKPCGADGLPGLAVPEGALLLAEAAPAALIGRIGGSSATLKVPDTPGTGLSKPFAVGSRCVVELPAKAVGPLYLGFNLRHRPVTVTALRVKVSKASPVFAGGNTTSGG
jgi:hypothetical protein